MGDFDFLRDDEKEVFFQILNRVKEYKSSSTKPRQIRKIVPIEEWLNNPYYVGPSGMALYPYWKEQMIKIFSRNSNENCVNELLVDGSLGCRPLGTKYHTSAGYLTLDEIRSTPGDVYVNASGGTKKIIGCHNVGQKPVIEIEFSNGYIMKATEDHRIRVLTSKGIEWRRFDEITLESNVLYSQRSEGYDGEVYDYEKSYLMGFIYGDGYITCNVNKVYNIVGVMINCNDSLHDYVVKLAVKYLGGNPKTYAKDNYTFTVVRRKNEELINEWDGIGHADNKKIPNWFFSKSLKDKSEFLSGLFDTDGYIGRDDIELTLNSKELIEQVRSLLKEFGIGSAIDWCRSMKRNRLHIRGKQNWKRLNEILNLRLDYKKDRLNHLAGVPYSRNERTILYGMSDYLYEECCNRPFVAPRKSLEYKYKNIRYNIQNITLEVVKRFYEECEWAKEDKVIEKFVEDDIMIIRPKRIYRTGMIECGDIEVEGHEYINEGVIQHNTGKSTMASFCFMRKLYEISCYENIPGLFGLMPGTIISFIYFSVSKTQAELTGYGQLKNIIDQSPYFQEHFPRYDRIQSMMVFPENIIVIFGSETTHSIGLNMMGSILDEANFRQANAQNENASSSNSKVSTMYASIINRAASRFLHKGKNSALSILVSSNTTSSSFTEQRKKQLRRDPHAYLINARLWDVKPKGTYDFNGFWTFVGNETLDPMIVDTLEEVWQVTDSWNIARTGSTVEDCISKLSDNYKEYFTWTPNDFRKQYEDNIIMSLQDISGYSVAPSGRLFSSRPAYAEACNTNFEHPFTKNVIVLSTQSDLKISDWIKKDWYPMHRNKPRFIHFDQSLAHDRTGVASTYLDHWEKDPDTGVYKPYYSTDILMSVAPPKPPAKISISKCMDLVYHMRDVWGLIIGMVSYDSFQSAGALESFEANGIPCKLLSVDRTDEQYMYLVNCILQGQIKTYDHPVLRTELFSLIYDRQHRRVDHPKAYYGIDEATGIGTQSNGKDLCDGWAGSLWSCYQSLSTEMQNQYDTDMNMQINRNNIKKSILQDSGYGDDIFSRVINESDYSSMIV